MTPKEKAEELFEKFKPIAHANLFSFREESHVRNCKLGALIVVDEIIKITCLHHLDYKEYKNPNTEFTNYWKEVKEELNKF